eukprot:SAG22_NODE_432_length_10559_cov_29.404225_4_plen_217_part_00
MPRGGKARGPAVPLHLRRKPASSDRPARPAAACAGQGRRRAIQFCAVLAAVLVAGMVCTPTVGRHRLLPSPLPFATVCGSLLAVKLLVALGADLDEGLGGGGLNTDVIVRSLTPLYIASKNGREDIARHLLEHGAAVNIPDDFQTTPLGAAASEGHEAVVRVLLAHSAAVDTVNSDGQTAVFLAANSGRAAVLVPLLEGGSPVDMVRDDGRCGVQL